MSEQRIKLTAQSQKRLAAIVAQAKALDEARAAIITGILDANEIEVSEKSSIAIEADAIVVTTPDKE